MADIFISYNRQDAPVAEQFVKALESGGFEVWWDATLKSGDAYDEVTEAALRSAKAVIVLWSQRSVKSRWVRAEATLADRQGTMVPVMIEECERPIMFELTQSADLIHWQGDTGDPAWHRFADDLAVFLNRPPPRRTEPAASAPAVPDAMSIAVLPFANLGGEQDNAYLGLGVAEEIINALVKVEALKVTGRTSSFSFRDSDRDSAAIARELKVANVLEGSIRTHGDRVRITAQLTDASDGTHSWSESFDGSLKDIFDLQDEIARSVAKALKVVLGGGPDRLASALTTNPDAYDAFLQGRELFRRLEGPETLNRAIEFLDRAVALDPQFGEAWLFLALSHLHLPDNAVTENVRGHYLAASRAIECAKSTTCDEALFHRTLGAKLISELKWDETFANYERAYAIDPRGIDVAFTLGYSLAAIGLSEKAMVLLEEARQLDPASPFVEWWIGMIHAHNGDLNRALTALRRCLDLGFINACFPIAALLCMQGKLDEAIEFSDRYVTASPWSMRNIQSPIARKVYYAAQWGRKPFARWLVARSLRARIAKADYQPNWIDGSALLNVGAVTDYMRYVRRHTTTYSFANANMMFWPTPDAKKLRTHPDFPQFVEDIGFVRLWQQHGWPPQITPHPGTDGSNLQFTCT